MAIQMFQHWVGEMVVEAGEFPTSEQKVDEWFPFEPEGATLVATDEYPEPTDVFEDVIRIRGKLGPIKIRVNVDIAFAGKVEYWKGAGGGG
jgi:hypothetical protein